MAMSSVMSWGESPVGFESIAFEAASAN